MTKKDKPTIGRPKIPDAELKKFSGSIKLDAALDAALSEEQARREKEGLPSNRAGTIRALLIKGLSDLGHDVEEASGD